MIVAPIAAWAVNMELRTRSQDVEIKRLQEEQMKLANAQSGSNAILAQYGNTLAAIQSSLDALSDMVRHMRDQIDRIISKQ